ncbi:AMP-binding protein [Sediminitomix flava]|uniref:Long-chain acyl-CoA synthetase n=1 Tax=Sediminitomix flava TaxID=379075 RepID=A0A315YYK7_SEDFL|nr:AMP-binding protein [Sediminitomix flava]PWJ35036.1 long-chain acyl-CoA synthetase [Sediminitomix flava]
MKPQNIQELFTQISQAGKKEFAKVEGKKYTYKDFLTQVQQLQTLFNEKGLKEGDKVILSVDDDYYTSLFFLAFLKCGITTVFIDPNVPVLRANGIIAQINPQALVMDEALFEERKIEEKEGVFSLKVGKQKQRKGMLMKKLFKSKKTDEQSSQLFPAILDGLAISEEEKEVSPETTAYIIFTSGTTAAPKGVMISHMSLFHHLQTLSKVYGMDENTRILNILMLYHADGCIQGPLLTAFTQGTWLKPFRFDMSHISEIFHLIYKERITHFITVPTILSFLNAYSEDEEDSFQTEDFQCVVSVASKLEEHLWTSFEEKFKTTIVNVYGLTETVAGGLFSGFKNTARKRATVGVPVDCEAKIVNAEGAEVPSNEVGELLVKGENLFSAYYENEEATQKVMQDGWFSTGDLAQKDEEGFITIKGRSKNTINSGGLNVYPEQVAEMINRHDAVQECVVVGMPDTEFGEKITAAIVRKTGQNLEKNDLIQFLRPLLEVNQMPKAYHFFENLPKGLSSKIQLDEVKRLIAKKTEDSEVVEMTHDVSALVKESASKAFGVEESQISSDDNSHSLDGWDSMAHLDFITQLEKQLNIRFTTAEMITMNSIQNTENILKRKLK